MGGQPAGIATTAPIDPDTIGTHEAAPNNWIKVINAPSTMVRRANNSERVLNKPALSLYHLRCSANSFLQYRAADTALSFALRSSIAWFTAFGTSAGLA